MDEISLCANCMYGHNAGVCKCVRIKCGHCRGQGHLWWPDGHLEHLKIMAGINTAVTGVGTGVGAGALATGIVKTNVDKEIAALESEIQKLIAESANEKYPDVTLGDTQVIRQKLADVINAEATGDAKTTNTMVDQKTAQLQQETEKSKTLGNVRTGLMATNTATNIAGAVIAGTNQIKDDLEAKIGQCILSVNKLNSVYMQERIQPGTDSAQIAHAESIISACGAWETAGADIASVNKRTRGAAVSAGIGAGVGLAGTITSGVANSDSVRSGDAVKEQKANTAANILAGGATVASAASTVFNATQIAAVKRVVDVAEKCEEVLK